MLEWQFLPRDILPRVERHPEQPMYECCVALSSSPPTLLFPIAIPAPSTEGITARRPGMSRAAPIAFPPSPHATFGARA
jgi:hypothetical protein